MFAHKLIVNPRQNEYKGIISVLSKRLILCLKMTAFSRLF
jgi:hypothetical protein